VSEYAAWLDQIAAATTDDVMWSTLRRMQPPEGALDQAQIRERLIAVLKARGIGSPARAADSWIASAYKHRNGATPLVDTGPPPADVDGAAALEAVRDYTKRYVVLPTHTVKYGDTKREVEAVADFLGLWVLHTHAFEAAFATPYPRVISAAPDSGKSTLLEVLGAQTHEAWYVINPSTAVLYRMIDQRAPTLLLDEMDN
jgi:hypothetical protein